MSIQPKAKSAIALAIWAEGVIGGSYCLRGDRTFAASADIGYATERARWSLGLGVRSAITLQYQ
ncbi:hypothetical protein H6F96_11645 [Microcoleus sp. FACHB-53]|nr:hypothetical protein [Microcoleus sp. FACHB-53]